MAILEHLKKYCSGCGARSEERRSAVHIKILEDASAGAIQQ